MVNMVGVLLYDEILLWNINKHIISHPRPQSELLSRIQICIYSWIVNSLNSVVANRNQHLLLLFIFRDDSSMRLDQTNQIHYDFLEIRLCGFEWFRMFQVQTLNFKGKLEKWVEEMDGTGHFDFKIVMVIHRFVDGDMSIGIP